MTHCTDHGPDQKPLMVAYNRYGLHWAGSKLVPSSTSYFSLTAVKILSALPRSTARPNLCSSQRVSLLSPVASVIRLPISDISAAVDSPYTPAEELRRANTPFSPAPWSVKGVSGLLKLLHDLPHRWTAHIQPFYNFNIIFFTFVKLNHCISVYSHCKTNFWVFWYT